MKKIEDMWDDGGEDDKIEDTKKKNKIRRAAAIPKVEEYYLVTPRNLYILMRYDERLIKKMMKERN